MPDATKTPEPIARDPRSLPRMVAWGVSAVFAAAVSIWVSVSPPGIERLQTAMKAPGTAPAPATNIAVAQISPKPEVLRPFDGEAETKRLTQLVQLLAADRDRLATRLGALERTMEDVTGSVKRNSERVEQLSVASTPPPVISAPATVAAVASPPSPANDNAPPPPTNPPTRAAAVPFTEVTGAVPTGATATEFAIDLGAASTIDGLRALWLHTKQSRAPLLDSLQPAAALRATKSGAPQLRLIAGPFPTAGAASNVCAAFAAGQGGCKTTAFDGQKLSAK